METIDFYSETKWCETCHKYVRFLMSVDHSFCVHCGSKVRLFSKKDWEAFHAAVSNGKQTARKPRRNRAS